jgi:chloramphenicol O-acetyltransferase type A
MRQINLETWPRREHFRLYNKFDHPHFGMCANVDLTRFYPYIKRHGISFTIATVYIIAKTANEIPEFRYRIRPGVVIEHESVHPSTTIFVKEELFSFCTFTYVENFSLFASQAAKQIARVKANPTLEDGPEKDELLFMTAIPWVSFTSFMHPMHLQPADSVPRFAWGKFYKDGETLKMPLSVQAHHALMDGFHVGQFFEKAQDYLSHPDIVLGDN